MTSTVAIGISTRNRWEDLRSTLTKLAKFGLEDCPTFIIDDGSDVPCPFDRGSLSPQVQVTRFTESRGYIVRRNQLAQQMDAKYYLSLDDDSYPVAGSLDEALAFAESHPDLLSLSFPIFNPVTREEQVRSLRKEPYKVRSFVGCAHLLNRMRFLDLGGYREELIHQGEEVELSARAFQQQLYCYHYPGFQFHHTESDTGRNKHRIDYYGTRNNVLWNDWFVPPRSKLIKQSRTLLSSAALFVRTGRVDLAKGQIAGFKDAAKYRNYRQPMSAMLYEKWKGLPAH